MDWKRPLKGLVVLDLSDGITAAFTGRLFAQLGATVWRPLNSADDILREVRQAPGDFQQQANDYLHAGKLPAGGFDIRSDEELAKALRRTDFVIHDRGKAFADRLLNSNGSVRVISVSEYGWDGPYSVWRSDSLVMQSISGIAALVGDPRREPLMLPGFVTQYSTGMLALIAGFALRMNPAMRDRHVLVTEIETGQHPPSIHLSRVHAARVDP